MGTPMRVDGYTSTDRLPFKKLAHPMPDCKWAPLCTGMGAHLQTEWHFGSSGLRHCSCLNVPEAYVPGRWCPDPVLPPGTHLEGAFSHAISMHDLRKDRLPWGPRQKEWAGRSVTFPGAFPGAHRGLPTILRHEGRLPLPSLICRMCAGMI